MPRKATWDGVGDGGSALRRGRSPEDLPALPQQGLQAGVAQGPVEAVPVALGLADLGEPLAEFLWGREANVDICDPTDPRVASRGAGAPRVPPHPVISDWLPLHSLSASSREGEAVLSVSLCWAPGEGRESRPALGGLWGTDRTQEGQGKHRGASEQGNLHQASEVWEGFLEEKRCARPGRHGCSEAWGGV